MVFPSFSSTAGLLQPESSSSSPSADWPSSSSLSSVPDGSHHLGLCKPIGPEPYGSIARLNGDCTRIYYSFPRTKITTEINGERSGRYGDNNIRMVTFLACLMIASIYLFEKFENTVSPYDAYQIKVTSSPSSEVARRCEALYILLSP